MTTTPTPADPGDASSAISLLRAELGRSQRSLVAAGTVVRFKFDGYTYAAVFAVGCWYLTGKFVGHHLGSRVFGSTKEFVDEVLSRATDVQVATQFESL